MALEQDLGLDLSMTASTAGGALEQYGIVRSTAADTIALCTSSINDVNRGMGILQNDPASGQAATVRWLGKSKCVAGGTINIGDLVTSTTVGRALAAGTTGQSVIGTANSATTAAGQLFDVFLGIGGRAFVGSTS